MRTDSIGGQISSNHYNQLSQQNQLFPEKGHHAIVDASSNGISKKQEAFIAARGDEFKRFLHDMTPKMQMDYMNQNFSDNQIDLTTSASHLSAAQSAFVEARGPAFKKWFGEMKPEQQKGYLAENFGNIPSKQASAKSSTSSNLNEVFNLAFTAVKGLFNGIGGFFSGLLGITNKSQ